MEAMTMTMPKILDCAATECSYNRDKKCHTMAITIGDAACPLCDTYLKSSTKGGSADVIGAVGACKEGGCRFNKAFECTASGIKVGMHEGHAECMSFTKR